MKYRGYIQVSSRPKVERYMDYKANKLIEGLKRAHHAAYNPKGHFHEDPRKAHYISISQVTSKTACAYFDGLDAEDDVPRYYTFKGDGLAEAHVRRLPDAIEDEWHALREELGWVSGGVSEEVAVSFPLRYDDWDLRGAMDALLWTALDHITYYAVGEYKAHGVGTEDKDNVALRQGTLYLAILLLGARKVGFAPWSPHHGQTITRGSGATPFGVFVNIADDHLAAGRSPFTPFTIEELQEHLDFYLAKSRKIARAIAEGDRSYCEEWDREHPDEFLEGYDPEDPEAVDQALERYHDVTGALNRLFQEKRQLEEAFHNTILAGEATRYEGDRWAIEAPFQQGRRSVRVGDVRSLIEDARGNGGSVPADDLESIIRRGKTFRQRHKVLPIS